MDTVHLAVDHASLVGCTSRYTVCQGLFSIVPKVTILPMSYILTRNPQPLSPQAFPSGCDFIELHLDSLDMGIFWAHAVTSQAGW